MCSCILFAHYNLIELYQMKQIQCKKHEYYIDGLAPLR